MAVIPSKSLSKVFSYLEPKLIFKSGEVSRQWRNGARGLDAWLELRLCAQRKPKTSVEAKPDYPCPESNIYLLGENGLFCIAKRLCEVAEEASVDEVVTVLPVRPKRPAPDSVNEKVIQFPSQVEVFKYKFGATDYWFLQYNTECFGWFDHTTEVALGLKIWAPCLVMCNYFCGEDAPVLKGRRCLELGAGAGLMGVVLGQLGAQATVTDIDQC
eukprot:TRINITY_DN7260_c0_g1_i2.p1 TRINITY_DN7260_c0_g1~~TRINITY_DN7260_c0_g1_i2.p1  ORF type:complete len:214 (+),score=37.35 TRINITY_DN7260_c0_g1_i2:33-674(+)